MKISEIISLISLIVSVGVFLTGLIVFFKESGREREDEGERTAKIESTLDFIKIQTELINVQNKAISSKLDSQNARLIVVEQVISTTKLSDMPLQLARLEESVKSAHKRISEIEK